MHNLRSSKAVASCWRGCRGPVQITCPVAVHQAAANYRVQQHVATPLQQRSHSCISLLICRSSKTPQQPISSEPPPGLQDNMDDMDDVIMIDDEGEEVEFEDNGDSDDEGFEDDGFLDDEGEDYISAGSESDPGPEILTGNVTWGDKALEVAQAVLSRPENSNLQLYLFRVMVPTKTIEIRLDRLDDVYGSPDLEDIQRFSRALQQGLEADLGSELAGEISFEVSSPGAERSLLVPQELNRFKDLPMRVEFMTEVGKLETMILIFIDMDESEDMSTWELADVKANQQVKGRGLSKKQRLQRYSIRISELERVRIFVDF
eukprot:GHUV01005605.1.p1 GENE.GHUV01005605.1~~GHUV01005605.1.p1  ORF type:complete len:318 (+),score=71.92 GHUV01005605.1:423-1376(+)